MKKQIFGFCTAICLLIVMVCPAFATVDNPPFDENAIPFKMMVTDSADLLTDDEEAELSARAWELTKEYQCGVYIVTLYSLHGVEVWKANEHLWNKYEMGYGEDQSGIVLLLSTEYRDYDIAAHGYGNVVFTDYGKKKMAERFLDEFGNDDWYGGFTEYLDCCEDYLQLAYEGEPFDVGSTSLTESDSEAGLTEVVISILVSLIIAFCVCSRFKAQMKTAKMQDEAQIYIDQRGLVLTSQSDEFTHTTRSKRYVAPKESSGGTTVNDDGFSHESGKF